MMMMLAEVAVAPDGVAASPAGGFRPQVSLFFVAGSGFPALACDSIYTESTVIQTHFESLRQMIKSMNHKSLS